MLVVWGMVAASRGRIALPAPATTGSTDVRLYEAITARVAAGQGYYEALAVELPSRGYAVRPVFNWRLPTLTWINALPPSPLWGRGLIVGIGVGAIVLWLMAIRRSRPRAAMVAVPVVGFAIVPLISIAPSIVFYEIWAGLLVAAAVACSGLGWWRSGVACGAAALAIRELALPFVLVMAAVALIERRRHEAVAWLGVVAVFAVLYAWHVSHVLAAMPPQGLSNTWLVTGGWPFVLKSLHSSVFAIITHGAARPWVLAVAVPLLWAGLWHWQDAVGRRLAWVVTAYFVLFMAVGRPDNWYWGFMIATLVPLGAFGFVSDRPIARRRRR